MPLLPVTPHPFAEESIFSWMMRVAEGNFAGSMWDVFGLAGFTQSEMKTSRIDTSRLWHLISEDESVLDGLGYRHGEAMAFRGQPILASDLHVMAPKICPQCIDENGYASAHWDLELVTACHIHRRRLIDSCPSCGAKITWFRASMVVCPCGASFREGPVVEPSHDEIDLNRLMYEVAFDKPRSSEAGNSAYESLGRVPLRYLLRFITAIGMLSSHGRIVMGKRTRAPISTFVPAAAEILSGWPGTCHDFLLRLTSRPSHIGQERFGVLGKINDLLRSILDRPDDRKHGAFLRKEIYQFLAHTWDGSIEGRLLDSLLAEGLTPRWLPLSKAAEILKTDRRTITEIMNRGLIEHKSEPKRKARRVLLRTVDIKPEWFAPTQLLSDRKGAALVGIPVSVLKELRITGDYVQTYFGGHSIGYAVRDLVVLKNRILAGSPFTPTDAQQAVSFAALMKNVKLRNETGKAQIVRAIMSGRIRIANAESGSVPDLLLHPDDLAHVRESVDTPSAGQLTVSQAAHELHSNPRAVKHLIAHGYLESRQTDQVELASIRRFLDSYTCLAKLLHYKDKIARAEELCAKEGVSVVVVPGQGEGTARRYIQTIHLPLIRKYLMKRATRAPKWRVGVADDALPVAKRRIERPPSRMDRLRGYLAGLRDRGELLPRMAGKPVISVIARECGMDRGAFYDERFGKMLDDHDRDEQARGGVKPDNPTALRSYLARIDALGFDLPLNGSKPNLFIIARACGFHRNAFYTDHRLTDLLAERTGPAVRRRLTTEERSEIGKRAAAARWGKQTRI